MLCDYCGQMVSPRVALNLSGGPLAAALGFCQVECLTRYTIANGHLFALEEVRG